MTEEAAYHFPKDNKTLIALHDAIITDKALEALREEKIKVYQRHIPTIEYTYDSIKMTMDSDSKEHLEKLDELIDERIRQIYKNFS